MTFLCGYVRDFVPAPAITEDDHWVVTLRTQAGVLSRINIGPVHVAVVLEDPDQGRYPVRLWRADCPLRAALSGGEFADVLSDAVARVAGEYATQPAGGADQVSFPIGSVADARHFLTHPAVAQAVRLYNARQVIGRTRWHSAHVPALVDGAFADSAV